MTTYQAPICFFCKHLKRDGDGDPDITEEGRFTCSAYPQGIPEAIITSEVDHRQPYKGDNGIQFEQDTSRLPL